jgi:hypothetical protein
MTFTQDGSRNNSRNNTGITVWTSVAVIWGKWRLSTSHCHCWRNMNLPLRVGEQRPEYAMETQDVPRKKEVQILVNSKKSDADTFLGFSRSPTWALSGMGCGDKQWTLQWDTAWHAEARDPESQGVRPMLLHDIACPHTAAHSVQIIQQLLSKCLEHPSYSPWSCLIGL